MFALSSKIYFAFRACSRIRVQNNVSGDLSDDLKDSASQTAHGCELLQLKSNRFLSASLTAQFNRRNAPEQGTGPHVSLPFKSFWIKVAVKLVSCQRMDIGIKYANLSSQPICGSDMRETLIYIHTGTAALHQEMYALSLCMPSIFIKNRLPE